MKILLITDRFGDKIPTGVISRRLCEELKDLGHEIAVVSSQRIGEKWLYGPHVICNSKTIIPARVLISLSNFFGKNLSSFMWRRRAFKASLKLIRSFKPDVIYARSTPISACEVASDLKDMTGIKVMMHFTDPVPAPIEWDPDISYRRRMIYTMNRILPKADLISFGNQAMIEYQQNLLKIDFASKSYVSPDPGPSSNLYYSKPKLKDRLVLVYLGSLYGNRNPQPLFDSITELNKEGKRVELKIYDINRVGTIVPNNVAFVGRTDDVRSALLDADILVNLDGDDNVPVFISSKLKEYLFCGRPIISITPINSPTRLLTNALKSVTSVENNVEQIIHAIINYSEFHYDEDVFQERSKIIERFNPHNIAKEISDRLIQLISNYET